MGSLKITVFTKEDFRTWLQKNHKKEKKVEVIIYKKHTGKKAPTHRELIEEAISFGWIDTTIKRIDDMTYLRTFTRRNQNSRWSNNTISYAKKLIEEERMTPLGLKFYKLGLQKPTHDQGIPKNPPMPPALAKALSTQSVAKKNFEAFSPSTKKIIYRWILRAKREETKGKRISKTVALARIGKAAFFNK